MKNLKTKFAALFRVAVTVALLALASSARAQSLNAKISAAEPKYSKSLLTAMASGAVVAPTNAACQFTTATFYGYSAVSATGTPTANGAAVTIGFTDASATTTNLTDSIPAGSFLAIKAPPGTKYDLQTVRLLGTTGDKVLIVYEQ